MNTSKLLTVGTLLMLLWASQAFSQNAGSVSFAVGDVSAEREPAEALAKGDTVLVSDAILTGPASRAQLMMLDGARIAVRPDSRIVIDEYQHAAATQTGSAVSTSTEDSSVISLVKGGFRSITGAIGDDNPQNVEVRTAVGVLGIRGTDFAVLLCGSCDAAPGVPPGTSVPQGLYIMVTDGAIVFRNEVSSIEVAAGEYAFVPLTTRQPTHIDTTPPVFIDDSDFRFADDDALPSGFDNKLGLRRDTDPSAPPPDSSAPGASSQDDGERSDAPTQPIIGTDEAGNPVDLTPGTAADPGNRTISYSTGPLGAVDTIFSGVFDNAPGQYQADGNGSLTGFGNLYPARSGPDIADFQIGSAGNVETGSDSMTVLRWGRWSGGTAAITLSDASNADQDLNNQSLHWVAGPESMTPVTLPVSGQASYVLLGGTAPTDNQGSIGVLGAASFQADFTNMRVDSSLSIDINGSNWTASGNGSISPVALFQGIYDAVAVDGISGGNGVFSGFFSAPGATSNPALPGGVGLTYSLQDANGGTSVSGAAAFGNP